jgi:protein-tyrosine phosphatase
MDEERRHWRLEGATNFRDLGGYAGAGGRPVRWRRLFRSDHLGALTAADLAALAPLGISAAIDFRGAGERAAALYELPGAALHALAIEPTVVQRLHDVEGAGRPPNAVDAAALMRDLYRRLAVESTDRYGEFFERLLSAQGPVVFHCTAGKDRTGFAAALLLLALGVDRAVVMDDYLLTNEVYRRPPPSGPSTFDDAVLAVLWSVDASFLEAALDAVDAVHGGIDRYLAALGVGERERTLLAARYLEGR